MVKMRIRITAMSKKLTKEEIITRFTEVHGKKYIYDLFMSDSFNYTSIKDKIPIICKKHNTLFKQSIYHHSKGEGCPICANESMKQTKSLGTEGFIERSREVHGDKYDYSNVSYVNNSTKVEIKCNTCGTIFQQLPSKHLEGQGCPECARRRTITTAMAFDTFRELASRIHQSKYDYDKDSYTNSKGKVTITCPVHGVFEQEAESHLQGHGCPKCAREDSKNEKEISDFISQFVEVRRNVRDILPSGRELDIYIPSRNLAIEYNGLIWHSELFGKTKTYHKSKMDECNSLGIRLITIFEDEYLNHKDICYSKLISVLSADNSLDKVDGRKCEIRPLEAKKSAIFHDLNHIQGKCNATVHYGAFYKEELVSVMSFLRTSGDEWELVRFSSDINKRCRGVGGKLFKYFLRENKPSMVKSFADLRWSSIEGGNIYEKLGFVLDGKTSPSYTYVSGKRRIHKFNFRKELLSKRYGFDMSLTEKEMAEQLKCYRIWDCGLARYIYRP